MLWLFDQETVQAVNLSMKTAANTMPNRETRLQIDEKTRSTTSLRLEPILHAAQTERNVPIGVSENHAPCNQIDRKIFTAPPGVKRYNVKWSNIRRNIGGERFIFVWPQKTQPRKNYSIYFAPLLRRMLIGLMYLGSVHLWPGEFLPTTIPSKGPLPKPTVKCNVIEPLWEEEDKIATKSSR